MRDDEPTRGAIPIDGWKLRFDAPPQPGDSRRAESGDVLALFRAWEGAMGNATERRRNRRYEPAETRTWIGWWKHGHFVVTPAEIVNLSEGGAFLRLARKPPTSQPVWICLGTPNPVDYVQARVLEVTPAPALEVDPFLDACDPARFDVVNPSYQTRLEFREPCPSSFFQAAGRLEDSREG